MRREAAVERLRGALWVMPTVAVGLALIAGSVLSSFTIDPASSLAPLRASSAKPRSSVLTRPTLGALSDRTELATGHPNPQWPKRFDRIPHHAAAGRPNDRIATVERGLR